VTNGLGATLGTLVDLVMPAHCAGCDAPATHGVCRDCEARLRELAPYETVPTPAPLGLPPCLALGAYEGPLRQLVLAYKDDGRHRLARPLAVPLARGVAASVLRLGRPPRSPIVVIPVPSTAAAARARHGDHMRRLARHVIRSLRDGGWPAALAQPATARPRPDSAHLSAAGRAVAARDAFRVRAVVAERVAAAARGASVIVIDDVLTTGATLAALTELLHAHGVRVDGAATLAATVRRAV
jgi:predicted amidophosphoribosyltransferase